MYLFSSFLVFAASFGEIKLNIYYVIKILETLKKD